MVSTANQNRSDPISYIVSSIYKFYHFLEDTVTVEAKLIWLKRTLIFKILVVACWACLPAAPARSSSSSAVTMPEDPFFMRIFGGVMIGLVFLYWFGTRTRSKNRDIIRYAVIDNSLSFLTILGVGLTTGSPTDVWWAVLVLLFAIASGI